MNIMEGIGIGLGLGIGIEEEGRGRGRDLLPEGDIRKEMKDILRLSHQPPWIEEGTLQHNNRLINPHHTNNIIQGMEDIEIVVIVGIIIINNININLHHIPDAFRTRIVEDHLIIISNHRLHHLVMNGIVTLLHRLTWIGIITILIIPRLVDHTLVGVVLHIVTPIVEGLH